MTDDIDREARQAAGLCERWVPEARLVELAAILAARTRRDVAAERARCLAIVDEAWKSEKLKPGTRMAMAVIAGRIRGEDVGDDDD